MILVASKADVANPERLGKLGKYAKRKKIPLYRISAVTGEGVKELQWAMATRIRDLREGRSPEVALEEEIKPPKSKAAKKKSPAKKKAVRSRTAKKKTTRGTAKKKSKVRR
jgi:GTP-binding protein